jgi:vacuolar-type H+-ATPase subunit I/STV1
MSIEKTVFSRLFDNKKHKAQLKSVNRKKVNLGLVDEISYEFSYLEDQSGLLSYLAYEWHEEKFEEYRQAWMTLNDEYKHNGSAVIRYEDVSQDKDTLNQIAEKAAELGLEPYEVYDRFDEHMELLSQIEEADDQYKRNEMEFRDWS